MAPRQRFPLVAEEPDDASPSPPPPITRKRILSSAESSLDRSTAEADLARDRHDIFNLLALLPLIVLTVVNWDWNHLREVPHDPEKAWIGHHFMEYWCSTIAYFIVDLAWVYRVPICVKSPQTIIKHHSIVVFYLLAPLVYPQYRWFMGACLSVEINTWFLIARRLTYKRPELFCLIPLFSEFVSLLFYATWVIIRCGVYPMVLMSMLILLDEGVRETGTWRHPQIMFIPVHFCLCCLNLKWTYDLFKPMVKKIFWDRDGAKIGVSSGL